MAEIAGYITVDVASERYGLSGRQLRRLCKKGKLPGAVKVGWAWVIREEEIARYVEERREEKDW